MVSASPPKDDAAAWIGVVLASLYEKGAASARVKQGSATPIVSASSVYHGLGRKKRETTILQVLLCFYMLFRNKKQSHLRGSWLHAEEERRTQIP